jgi:NADH-quinone oxidoreductase subunit A
METNDAAAAILFVACIVGLAIALLVIASLLNPKRLSSGRRMPYESGMDPVHDTRRRFDVRFHLMAIAFLVFDVELLFLYPWAVVIGSVGPVAAADVAPEPSAAAALPPNHHLVFVTGMVFIALLGVGFLYDWRKGVFRWR